MLNETQIETTVEELVKSVDRALPKGKSFKDMNNAEKSIFFRTHNWDGKNWVSTSLTTKIRSALTNVGKGATVGATTPDKLIPGLSDPKTRTTKALAIATRAAVLTVPGMTPIGAILGALYGNLNPNKVDKNYANAKKLIGDKLNKLFGSKK